MTPKHWPLWLGLRLLRLVAALPLRWQLAVGAQLGRLTGQLLRRRRRIAAVNLRLCFPQLSDAQQRTLLDQHFASLGMGLLETASAWWAPDRALRGRVQVNGQQYLEQARAEGRGVLLLTGHFTTLEIGARGLVLDTRCRFHAMYRVHKNPLYEAEMRRLREHHSGLAPLPRDDLRGVVRALRAGRMVWYAPDQNMGRSKDSVDVAFFGMPARTITATSRLARAGNALVLPYFPRRTSDGHYQIEILPPLADFPSHDLAADTARINALIETAVRSAPEQYLWVHRRFRPRRNGEPSPYT